MKCISVNLGVVGRRTQAGQTQVEVVTPYPCLTHIRHPGASDYLFWGNGKNILRSLCIFNYKLPIHTNRIQTSHCEALM